MVGKLIHSNSLPTGIMEIIPKSKNLNSSYQRSFSDHVNPSTECRYATIQDVIFERVDESQSIDTNSEIRISIESSSAIMTTTKKINPIQDWCRQHLPECITAHHLWLLIHFLITIVLLSLYFTKVMNISGGTISICELLFGVLVRNEIFISILHRLVALIPICRYECNRMLHCIGGLHVSAACTAFVWLLISLIVESHGFGARITGALLLAFIIGISCTAIPIVRRQYHNTFEYVHRYAGWTSLLILIVHVIFLQLDKYASFHINALVNLPVIVLFCIISIIFLPWICISKVVVEYAQPSNDLTIVTFPRALNPYGSTTRISLDGREWHAFAIALTNPYENKHSLVIAAAGDWTKELAENYRRQQLSNKMWVRQIKGLGFMYSIHAYRKVLIVCTGAGIAPALPYIKYPLPTTHTHLLWIAKQHREYYGNEVWTLVEQKYPHVTLHDTSLQGRPGVELVEDEFWRRDCEAVFIVSNEKLTNNFVNGLWKKGIPCFGALFDS